MKQCRKCRVQKDDSEFYKNSTRRGGLQHWCKVCINTQMKIRNNSAEGIEYRRQYKQSPKNKYAEYKRNAKKRNVPFILSIEQFQLFWHKPCLYCGDLIETIGLDQVNPGQGYTIENIVSCCFNCNEMKNNRSTKEFLEHCKKIVSHNSLIP